MTRSKLRANAAWAQSVLQCDHDLVLGNVNAFTDAESSLLDMHNVASKSSNANQVARRHWSECLC